MIRMSSLFIWLMTPVLLTSCQSKTYFTADIQLSKLSATTIHVDPAKYSSLNLRIENDLDTDVFLRTGTDGIVEAPINRSRPVRMPDMDERSRELIENMVYPMKYAHSFMYIWSGNSGSMNISHLGIRTGYLPIIYFSVDADGFITQSIRINCQQGGSVPDGTDQ